MSNNMMTNSLLFANDPNEPRRVPRSCAECVHVRNCRVKNCKVLRARKKRSKARRGRKSARISDNARQSLTRDSLIIPFSCDSLCLQRRGWASEPFRDDCALFRFLCRFRKRYGFFFIGSGATERRSARSCACSETDAVS